METLQIFQLLTIVFVGILPLIWNLVLRKQITKYNDHAGIIEYYKGAHEALGYLNFHHKIVTGILVSIGIVFGIIGILFS